MAFKNYLQALLVGIPKEGVSSIEQLMKTAEKIEGGRADGKKPSDFDADQVAMGEKVEREHTNDPAMAREISTDHLQEIPDYYSRLKKMEESAPKRKEAQGIVTDPYFETLSKARMELQQRNPELYKSVVSEPRRRRFEQDRKALVEHVQAKKEGLSKAAELLEVGDAIGRVMTKTAWRQFAPLIGAGLGAVTGAASAGEGHRLKGALVGGGLGAVGGGLAAGAAMTPAYLKHMGKAKSLGMSEGKYLMQPGVQQSLQRTGGIAAGVGIGAAGATGLAAGSSMRNKTAAYTSDVYKTAGVVVETTEDPVEESIKQKHKLPEQEKTALELHPAILGALLGGGVGAGIGALAPRDKEHRLRNTLVGAGVGATTGGLAGALSRAVSNRSSIEQAIDAAHKAGYQAGKNQAVDQLAEMLKQRGLV